MKKMEKRVPCLHEVWMDEEVAVYQPSPSRAGVLHIFLRAESTIINFKRMMKDSPQCFWVHIDQYLQ